MRVLHVVPSFGLGGMERVLCSIINGLPSIYHHEILALDQETRARKWIKNEAVTFLPFAKDNRRAKFFLDLYRAIKASNPNVLMTYNWGATDAIWLGRCAGIKTIIHNEHGFNVEEAGERLWKRDAVRLVVYRLARQVVVVSTQLKEILQHSYHLRKKQVTLIPNGLDLSYYSPDQKIRQRVRHDLGIQDDDILVGFIGRLDPVKNLTLMLNAFESCMKQNHVFKLLLVGEGPERAQVDFICREKNISRHVLLVGQKDDVLPYLRALDVFILTSLREQMPMSLLEAMAMGIPIVSTAVGDIPRFVDHESEGLLVDLNRNKDGVEAVASCLLRFSDSGKRQKMGNAARNKILTNCEEGAMLRCYEKLLERSE